MKNNHCCGFWYDSEEELKQLLGIDEYLDVMNGNSNGFWSPEPDEEQEKNQSYQTHDEFSGVDVFVKRMSEGLTQKELAKKIGISVETLSKVENGHKNLTAKVQEKIDSYMEEDF